MNFNLKYKREMVLEKEVNRLLEEQKYLHNKITQLQDEKEAVDIEMKKK